MNEKKSNLEIEKSVFETLQMQEQRNITARYHDLQVQLDRQMQKEKQLQERYQEIKDKLERQQWLQSK